MSSFVPAKATPFLAGPTQRLGRRSTTTTPLATTIRPSLAAARRYKKETTGLEDNAEGYWRRGHSLLGARLDAITSLLGGPTMFARIGIMKALNRQVERVFNPSRNDKHWGRRSWRGISNGSKRVFGLPITLEGEARRQATPWSMASASGQPDRIPSIEAPPALYRQVASQAPSRRRSARIAQMNWTGPCYNLTPRRSERPIHLA
jgi:hypothetical protein